MGFLSNTGNNNGGLMNVIRCDEKEYLVWKWRPNSQELGKSNRENSIRYGSSLRVKNGEVAVFVYSSSSETHEDFIIGPHDSIIKTANFPVLANMVGTAFGGNSPFQAEIYFINLANNIQLFFGVPYFDVFDPRFPDLPVPVAVRGMLMFNITDYKDFIKNNRLINFSLQDFKVQIKSAVSKYIKSVVINIPIKNNISVVQLESQIICINDIAEQYISCRFESDFGVKLKAMDIEAIEVNKETNAYKELKRITADIASNSTIAQSEINIKNLKDNQFINAQNLEETLKIQREEMQRAQRLQTEQNFLGAHALNQQTKVLETAAESLGKMGGGIGNDGNSGLNPAGVMTSMMMGSAVGSQMAGMISQVGQNMNQPTQQGIHIPPSIPQNRYYLYLDGQQLGPFDTVQLISMKNSGQLSLTTYVWREGMSQWDLIQNTELVNLFNNAENTPPPIHPTK